MTTLELIMLYNDKIHDLESRLVNKNYNNENKSKVIESLKFYHKLICELKNKLIKSEQQWQLKNK